MKYLIFVALVVLVLWGLRKQKASHPGVRQQAAREPERMVTCAFCGVNQPLSDSILSRGSYYCCVAHRCEADQRDE